MRCLILGDAHIPRRAKDIPSEIKRELNKISAAEPFDHTFFTGDVIKAPDLINLLSSRTNSDVFIVLGNMDYYTGNRNAPEFEKLDIDFGEGRIMTIGLTHGHDIKPRGDRAQLEMLAADRNYHLLISGHTHKEEIFLTRSGTLLLNPGSITGAWSFIASGIPSFLILKLDEGTGNITVQLNQLDSKSKRINQIIKHFHFDGDKIKNISI